MTIQTDFKTEAKDSMENSNQARHVDALKIQIIGLGVVGSAQAHLASLLGHEVLGFDNSKTKSGNARRLDRMERNVDLTFICTPEATVEDVVGQLVHEMVKGLYVIKSTVPPGTTNKLMNKYGIHICHNPEFLREKTAFEDAAHPNVVVIGECCEQHSIILRSLYLPLGCPIVVTEPSMSEMVKLTLNSYLAMLITFWNEIHKVALVSGLSTDEVAATVRLDPRVSAYGAEFFGAPFGGKCLPKDLNQLIEFGKSNGMTPRLLENIRDINNEMACIHPA